MNRVKINGIEYELAEGDREGYCDGCEFYENPHSKKYPCTGGDCNNHAVYKKVEEK